MFCTLEVFNSYYPKVIDIINKYLNCRTVDFVISHINELIQYSIGGGKCARGILTASSYLELTGYSIEDKMGDVGFILGWAIELLQAAFLVADDLMDRSQTRRGKMCWYLKDGVGDTAVNDTLIIENLVFVIIDSLRGEYLDDETVDEIVSELRRIITLTTIGESLDTKATEFDFKWYNVIVENKTSYYTFWIPAIISIIASKKIPYDKYMSEDFTKFLLDFGMFFQVQDDYLDVFSDEKVTGKRGTDIIDRKITWLSCKAYELSNSQQKELLTKSYETPEERYKAIYQLYLDLDIKLKFGEFSKEQICKLNEQLEKLDPIYPKKTLSSLFASLSKRKK